LETLLMSPYMGLSAFSSSACRLTSCCGDSNRWRK